MRWTPCAGGSTRVDAAGRHVGGSDRGRNNGTARCMANTFNGPRTGDSIGDGSWRCGSGKTGVNNVAQSAIYVRRPLRRASIDDERRVDRGSLTGRGYLGQFELQIPLSGHGRRLSSAHSLHLIHSLLAAARAERSFSRMRRSWSRAASCAHSRLACASAADVGDSARARAST